MNTYSFIGCFQGLDYILHLEGRIHYCCVYYNTDDNSLSTFAQTQHSILGYLVINLPRHTYSIIECFVTSHLVILDLPITQDITALILEGKIS